MARDAAATEVAQVRQQLAAHYDARFQQADQALRADAQSQAQSLQERLLKVEQSADRRLTNQAREFNTLNAQNLNTQREDMSRDFTARYD